MNDQIKRKIHTKEKHIIPYFLFLLLQTSEIIISFLRLLGETNIKPMSTTPPIKCALYCANTIILKTAINASPHY